jgi:hypothetical protein
MIDERDHGDEHQTKLDELKQSNDSLRAVLAVLSDDIAVKRHELSLIQEQNQLLRENLRMHMAPPSPTRCVTDADVEKAFYEGTG